VHQTRDDFLADTALAGDEDFRIGSRGVLDLRFDRADRAADAYQRFGGVLYGLGTQGLSSRGSAVDHERSTSQKRKSDAPRIVALRMRKSVPRDRRRDRGTCIVGDVAGSVGFRANDAPAADDGCGVLAAPYLCGKRQQHFYWGLQRHQMIGAKQHARAADVLRAAFMPELFAGLTVPQRDPERVSGCASERRLIRVRVMIHQQERHVPFKTVAVSP
jgi:hypothetical protein